MSRRLLTPEETKRAEWIFRWLGREVDLRSSDMDLLESFEEQFQKDGMLSDKQLNILEDIYNRYE